MRSDIVLTLLVANLGTIYGDFYSGTISWEAAAQPPSTQVSYALYQKCSDFIEVKNNLKI